MVSFQEPVSSCYLLHPRTLSDIGGDVVAQFINTRAYHRILKLAFTTADLAGSEKIQSVHLAEALQNRPKLMMG